MDGYLYLLESGIKKWRYIGSSRDLKARLLQHNNKKVISTREYAPLKLVYYEAYVTYNLARKREIELKTNNQQKEILFKRLGIY